MRSHTFAVPRLTPCLPDNLAPAHTEPCPECDAPVSVMVDGLFEREFVTTCGCGAELVLDVCEDLPQHAGWMVNLHWGVR